MRLLHFVIVFVVCSVINAEGGCSCDGSHPQTSYCEADFVFRVKVLDTILTRSDYKKYKVSVLEWYKADKYVHNLVSKHIGLLTTTFDGSGCGATLVENQKYVITGKVVGGQLTLGPCDWYVNYSDITTIQRMGITRSYGMFCKCKVHSLTDENEFNKYLCTTPKTPFSSECLYKHGICTKRSGRCYWKVDRDASICQ